MSDREIENLKGHLVPNLTKFVPHSPTAKQAAFLALNPKYKEAFFGGAAGGGRKI
jgi:hypothetical protein